MLKSGAEVAWCGSGFWLKIKYSVYGLIIVCNGAAMKYTAAFMFFLMAPLRAISSDVYLYDVYQNDTNGDGVPELLIVSQEPFTGKTLFVPIGVKATVVIPIDEVRRSIYIESDGYGGQSVISLNPGSEPDFYGNWEHVGEGVLYGDITGDGWQDMFVLGGGYGSSYSLSWNERTDQLVIHQVIDNEELKHYIDLGYAVELMDMNEDGLDDLVIKENSDIVHVVFASDSGNFYEEQEQEQEQEESYSSTADHTINRFLEVSLEGSETEILEMIMEGVNRQYVQDIISVIGIDEFRSKIDSIDELNPVSITRSLAEYEAVFYLEDGSSESYPIIMSRDKKGVWRLRKI